MIDEAGIDVVDITASVGAHHPVAVHAAARAKHVMVQKPMATSIAAAQDMSQVSQRRQGPGGDGRRTLRRPRADGALAGGARLPRQYRDGGSRLSGELVEPRHDSGADTMAPSTGGSRRRDQLRPGRAFLPAARWLCGPIARLYGAVRTFEPVRYRRSDDGSVLERVEVDADDTMFCQIEFELEQQSTRCSWRSRATCTTGARGRAARGIGAHTAIPFATAGVP